MAHNPTLHCNIGSSDIRRMYDTVAFFENILVTLNGSSTRTDLFGTSCRTRPNQYTVTCFHEDDRMETGSGGAIPLIMIMMIVILCLLGVIAFMCYKIRREQKNTKILMESLEQANILKFEYEQQLCELKKHNRDQTKNTFNILKE